MSIHDTLERPEELLIEEHGGCDNTTCSIQVAHSNGYLIHALDCFAGSGAASEHFYELFNSLPKSYVELNSRREANSMIKSVSHVECSCNAIVWELESNNGHCSNCGRQNEL